MPVKVYIFLIKKTIRVRFPYFPPYGKAGASQIDFPILVVTLSGIRIVAIASAFQAEYDRGFESHIPLHGCIR